MDFKSLFVKFLKDIFVFLSLSRPSASQSSCAMANLMLQFIWQKLIVASKNFKKSHLLWEEDLALGAISRSRICLNSNRSSLFTISELERPVSG